jgi:hypothetical protein
LLLDIVSYGHGGPGAAGRRLTPAQIEHIHLTVNRAPEVMVKVLSSGSSDSMAVGRHFDYIGRKGDLALEGDDGQPLPGRVGKALVEDWELEIDEEMRQTNLTSLRARKSPKLVHKLVFSMPSGTPPEKVKAAVRNLAREEFYGKHRYVMVLHTDEPHPHVHLVLKAISEDGVRLNIKKATLRHWRSQFAHHLRARGVAANATERAVRGQSRKAVKDGIYRASRRGASTYLRAQAESVARELVASGTIRPEPGKRTLLETREAVESGWWAVAKKLEEQGDQRLAADVVRFVGKLAQPLTDREWMAREILATARVRVPAWQREAKMP